MLTAAPSLASGTSFLRRHPRRCSLPQSLAPQSTSSALAIEAPSAFFHSALPPAPILALGARVLAHHRGLLGRGQPEPALSFAGPSRREALQPSGEKLLAFG